MKVSELIELLSDLDPDADVYLMSQPSWPFEVELKGVTTREDFIEVDEDEDEDGVEAPGPHDRWSARESTLPRHDVFLVEGDQIRYGSKAAWDALR